MNQTDMNAALTNDASPSTPQDRPTPNASTGIGPLFILASASSRRRELLELLSLPFIVILPDDVPAKDPISAEQSDQVEISMSHRGIDETPLRGESPPDLVQRLSRAKARAVAARLPSLDLPDRKGRTGNVIIIAADTEVASRA